MIVGSVKWIKFGHEESSFNQKGERLEASKAQKTAADFKGTKVGAGGSLQLLPKMYTHPTALSLNTAYQVVFHLKNADGDIVDETMSVPTNNEMSRDNPKVFTWADVKTLAIQNVADDILLCMTV